MIAIRGIHSAIAQELIKLLPKGEEVREIDRGERIEYEDRADRFFYCQGLLRPKSLIEQTGSEKNESLWVNAIRIIRDCDLILERNPKARICVMGSESGFAWSFDGAYSAAKAALHRYVETKRLSTPDQQLVCVAPSIIEDAGMTIRRKDQGNLIQRRLEHPKRRFLQAAEVAAMVHFLLYVDRGYTTGVVIRMNGAHA